MIDREHKLPIKRQAEVLSISRGAAYYKPRPVSERDLLLMRKLDELHLNYPFAGSRMLRGLLRQQGVDAGRLHLGTLMKKMGIEAVYRKRNTSKPAPGHRIYPYLLRDAAVTRPNQAWAMDISYIPMARGFVYLAAVVDWFSRKILAWKLSITMDVSFCLEAVEEALSKYGRPEIFNTDQGSQFTSEAFTEQLKKITSPSAWTERAAGATMSSWSGSGERSSTKRSISGPTTRSRRREPPWGNTSSSTTRPDPTRA
jgi:putative transposase